MSSSPAVKVGPKVPLLSPCAVQGDFLLCRLRTYLSSQAGSHWGQGCVLTQTVHHASHSSSGPADVMVPHVQLRVQCTAKKPDVVKGGGCVLGVWREPGSVPHPPLRLPLPCTRGGMRLYGKKRSWGGLLLYCHVQCGTPWNPWAF